MEKRIIRLFLFLAILVPPFIILIIFISPLSRWRGGTLITSSNWMIYASGVLSYTGTIAFGYAVYLQSERFQKVENERVRAQNIPLFSLQHFQYSDLERHLVKSMQENNTVFEVTDPEDGEIQLNGIYVLKDNNKGLTLSGFNDNPGVYPTKLSAILLLTNCGNTTANSINIYLENNKEKYNRIFCLEKDKDIPIVPTTKQEFTLVVEYKDMFMNNYRQSFEFYNDNNNSWGVKDALPEQFVISRGDILPMDLEAPDEDNKKHDKQGDTYNNI